MANLKTNYKDDVLNTEVNERRKYQMIQNDDGTVSFVDVTDYSQVGDSFGALDINATNEKCNEINSNLNNFGGDGYAPNNKVSSEKLYGRRIDSAYTYYCKTWVTSALSINQTVTYTDTKIQFNIY